MVEGSDGVFRLPNNTYFMVAFARSIRLKILCEVEVRPYSIEDLLRRVSRFLFPC